ncbi:hypothetical protein ACF061_14165 [Streptomyces sp. NPDC015220]
MRTTTVLVVALKALRGPTPGAAGTGRDGAGVRSASADRTQPVAV